MPDFLVKNVLKFGDFNGAVVMRLWRWGLFISYKWNRCHAPAKSTWNMAIIFFYLGNFQSKI